jgi:hypothetical protein
LPHQGPDLLILKAFPAMPFAEHAPKNIPTAAFSRTTVDYVENQNWFGQLIKKTKIFPGLPSPSKAQPPRKN